MNDNIAFAISQESQGGFIGNTKGYRVLLIPYEFDVHVENLFHGSLCIRFCNEGEDIGSYFLIIDKKHDEMLSALTEEQQEFIRLYIAKKVITDILSYLVGIPRGIRYEPITIDKYLEKWENMVQSKIEAETDKNEINHDKSHTSKQEEKNAEEEDLPY